MLSAVQDSLNQLLALLACNSIVTGMKLQAPCAYLCGLLLSLHVDVHLLTIWCCRLMAGSGLTSSCSQGTGAALGATSRRGSPARAQLAVQPLNQPMTQCRPVLAAKRSFSDSWQQGPEACQGACQPAQLQPSAASKAADGKAGKQTGPSTPDVPFSSWLGMRLQLVACWMSETQNDLELHNLRDCINVASRYADAALQLALQTAQPETALCYRTKTGREALLTSSSETRRRPACASSPPTRHPHSAAQPWTTHPYPAALCPKRTRARVCKRCASGHAALALQPACCASGESSHGLQAHTADLSVPKNRLCSLQVISSCVASRGTGAGSLAQLRAHSWCLASVSQR